jgi:hypothetical protein
MHKNPKILPNRPRNRETPDPRRELFLSLHLMDRFTGSKSAIPIDLLLPCQIEFYSERDSVSRISWKSISTMYKFDYLPNTSRSPSSTDRWRSSSSYSIGVFWSLGKRATVLIATVGIDLMVKYAALGESELQAKSR